MIEIRRRTLFTAIGIAALGCHSSTTPIDGGVDAPLAAALPHERASNDTVIARAAARDARHAS